LSVEQEEKATSSPCSPEALGLEALVQEEKAAFSPCSLGDLGLECLEREEASLMYGSFEQASACLK
jgi:hypothetical protein